uniref:Myosin heavy chain kinase putative n=1 Tax=Albugo laibachii Nc14 TaxID=890382 RepID=F0WLY9_9STRA|nr:myosin heavy chain kinase putative [Albugo laibachii Nc14]|eukprot:CCA22316.1 myosin heavy chain kinase putative [Albugo laibachii Nc14]
MSSKEHEYISSMRSSKEEEYISSMRSSKEEEYISSMRSNVIQTICIAELHPRSVVVSSISSACAVFMQDGRKRGFSLDLSVIFSSPLPCVEPCAWPSTEELSIQTVCNVSNTAAELVGHLERRRAFSETMAYEQQIMDAVTYTPSQEDWESMQRGQSFQQSESFVSKTLKVTSAEEPQDEKLQNLQKLLQEGFITITEFKERRLQLVDEQEVELSLIQSVEPDRSCEEVLAVGPPDFALLKEREAIKHVFDSEERKWTSSRIKVKLDHLPFAQGGLRQVYHLQDMSMEAGRLPSSLTYVAKVAMNPNENPDTYFRDVEMQAVAAKFANLYNSYNPPRRVKFLEAWIMQLMPLQASECPTNTPSRPASVPHHDWTLRGTICGVEPYIAGEYQKHNNNFGYVSELERNTPQAFSHFTYEISGHQMLIVDIQGVGDHYTDPQIHTRRGKEFGKGNLSLRGFARFLESHRCNAICRYLKLPLHNPRDQSIASEVNEAFIKGLEKVCDGTEAIPEEGTVPAQMYMKEPLVCVDHELLESQLCHYYRESHIFQQYRARKKKRQRQKQTMERDRWEEMSVRVEGRAFADGSGHVGAEFMEAESEAQSGSSVKERENERDTDGNERDRLIRRTSLGGSAGWTESISDKNDEIWRCGFCSKHLSSTCMIQ